MVMSAKFITNASTSMHCVHSKTDFSLGMVNPSDISKFTVLCTFSRQ